MKIKDVYHHNYLLKSMDNKTQKDFHNVVEGDLLNQVTIFVVMNEDAVNLEKKDFYTKNSNS